MPSPTHHYLRRFKRSEILQGGGVSPEAFVCDTEEKNDPAGGLSVYQAIEKLTGPEGIAAFQHSVRRNGNWPFLGVCRIRIGPMINKQTVIVRDDPQPDDPEYGHLHCLINCPDEDVQLALSNIADVEVYPSKA